ncbi:shootin-1 isoform X2 [Astatotilapia calliptera]|uniref:shootin-1 isoform X2 n=1 Tax=Maylandia zebra TaxID=106582 RepID=UPI000329C4A3|nr:shootin-1 isoform X2 [Maylandia zebra]XP_026018071.1 shootin-1-like isoform X2 [Astatotilapia calliptera]
MWVQDEDEDTAAADSDEECAFSSEDEEDLQWHILEKQRDEANHRLSELEEASNQLLKEINVLEIQFQIERSCRESAEALALKVTKENKVLKRKSQMLMPLIAELPENLPDVTFDPAVNGDEVDGDEVDGDKVDGAGGSSSEEMLLLESQAKITELQASVDGLLAEKLKLEQQVEDLTSEQTQLREQLALEVAEKEAILRKLNKQSKTVNKLKRVSQLVTDEFTEMSQKLELEQGLRQHAEVLATQMILEQKAAQASETDLKMQVQLEQALQQISQLSTALCDIQLYYQDRLKQSQSAVEESSALSELQNLREQLEKSEEERKTLETQLSDANSLVARLQEEVKELQQTLNSDDKSDEPGEKAIPDFVPLSPLPPPPPPPPPPPTTVTNFKDFLKSRKKHGAKAADDLNKAAPLLDMKARAVDEMMERIKKGIVLRPMKRIQEDDSSWKDQKSDNRKSAILELKGMLDNMKRQHLRRVPSRRGTGRNVGEAELLMVLQRRRRAMGDNQEPPPSNQPQVAGDAPWAGESGSAPVLRRLKQNREKRDSRIRASALFISHQA